MCKTLITIYILGIPNAWARSDDRIPVGLILAGHNIATYGQLFASIIERIELEAATKIIRIPSNQAASLKSILKYINRYATTGLRPSSQNKSESEEPVS